MESRIGAWYSRARAALPRADTMKAPSALDWLADLARVKTGGRYALANRNQDNRMPSRAELVRYVARNVGDEAGGWRRDRRDDCWRALRAREIRAAGFSSRISGGEPSACLHSVCEVAGAIKLAIETSEHDVGAALRILAQTDGRGRFRIQKGIARLEWPGETRGLYHELVKYYLVAVLMLAERGGDRQAITRLLRRPKIGNLAVVIKKRVFSHAADTRGFYRQAVAPGTNDETVGILIRLARLLDRAEMLSGERSGGPRKIMLKIQREYGGPAARVIGERYRRFNLPGIAKDTESSLLAQATSVVNELERERRCVQARSFLAPHRLFLASASETLFAERHVARLRAMGICSAGEVEDAMFDMGVRVYPEPFYFPGDGELLAATLGSQKIVSAMERAILSRHSDNQAAGVTDLQSARELAGECIMPILLETHWIKARIERVVAGRLERQGRRVEEYKEIRAEIAARVAAGALETTANRMLDRARNLRLDPPLGLRRPGGLARSEAR
ncbi:hypothetical protein MyNCGM683_06700 [Achromobacter xylosoxidans]